MPKKLLDLYGQKFGMLTVLKKGASGEGGVWWWCMCDCGNKTIIPGSHLVSGACTSCNCVRKVAKKRQIKYLTERNSRMNNIVTMQKQKRSKRA